MVMLPLDETILTYEYEYSAIYRKVIGSLKLLTKVHWFLRLNISEKMFKSLNHQNFDKQQKRF